MWPSVHHSQEIPSRTGYEQTAPESGAWRGCWPVSGWHPGLAPAELGALLPEASLRLETSDRWVRVSGAKEQRRQDALAVASGLQCFLVDGHVASTEESSARRVVERNASLSPRTPRQGFGCRTGLEAGQQVARLEPCPTSPVASGACFTIWAAPSTLNTPTMCLRSFPTVPTASLACGWMEGDGQAAFSNGERRAGERPFFKPVSLDPMLARLAVNLATGPLDRGPVVDPMTGTGGFLIEASLSGRPSVGIDIHSEMVQGAQANLVWAHNGEASTSHARLFEVMRRDSLMHFPNNGTVPWQGLCSIPLTVGILTGAWPPTTCLNRVCKAHGTSPIQMVVLCSFYRSIHQRSTRTASLPLDHDFALLNGEWSTVLAVIERCGWHPQSAHVERVHRSLSRLILHARCAPRD